MQSRVNKLYDPLNFANSVQLITATPTLLARFTIVVERIVIAFPKLFRALQKFSENERLSGIKIEWIIDTTDRSNRT